MASEGTRQSCHLNHSPPLFLDGNGNLPTHYDTVEDNAKSDNNDNTSKYSGNGEEDKDSDYDNDDDPCNGGGKIGECGT